MDSFSYILDDDYLWELINLSIILIFIEDIFVNWTKCSCKGEGTTDSLFFWYKDLKENTFKEIKDANKLYFKSLANTRASVSMLVIAWTGVLILATEIIAFYYYFNIGLKINPFSNIFFDLLVFIACYLVIAFFLPFLCSFVYKRQILSTAFLTLCYASIFFSLQLMMLLIVVTSISTKEFTIGFPKYSPFFVPLFIVETVLSFIYHYLCLKRQLKNGFSIK